MKHSNVLQFASWDHSLALFAAGNHQPLASLIAADAEARDFAAQLGVPPPWRLAQWVYVQFVLAAGNRDIARLRLLLDARLDPITCAHEGDESVMHILARHGWCDGIAEAIRRGRDHSVRTKHSATPLHFAAHHGSVGAGTLLLNAGADVDAVDETGNHALHFLVIGRPPAGAYRNLIRLLAKRGANFWARNHIGLTAMEVAQRMRSWGELAEMEQIVGQDWAKQCADVSFVSQLDDI